ncbi:hypothetical protein CC79DRAFT_1399977 [Sarocladium strictum]
MAVYNKVSKTGPLREDDVYPDNEFDRSSFSYAYVTPANVKLVYAFAKNEILAPDTGAFRALVLPDRSNTLQAIDSITEFAKGWLPIIVAGRPTLCRTHRRGEEEQTWAAAYKGLLPLPSVHLCKKGKVARTLDSPSSKPKLDVSSSRP